MTTLRQAAEQALEALMYCEPHCDENPVGFEKWADAMPALREALERPEWVGLTEDEINEVLGGDIRDEPSGELLFIRAIEAKLKEKNT